jgi:DNA polymerase-1
MARKVAIDTETDSVNAFEAKVTHASFCLDDGKAIAFEWSNKKWRRRLISLMEDRNWTKVFHNAKYDLRVLGNAGILPAGRYYDTMIMSQLCIDSRKHGLKELTLLLLKESYTELGDLKKWMRKNKGKLHEAPPELVLPYAKKDARCTMGLFHFLWQILEQRRMLPMLYREMALMRSCIIPMETRGVHIDKPELIKMGKFAKKRAHSLTKSMREMVADSELNPNSFQQMGRYVFAEPKEVERIQKATGNKFKKANPSKETPTGFPSTDNYSLRRADTPLSKMLLEYRMYRDAYTKYLKGMLDCADENDVIHATFNQMGARTGRFSCSNPNLQNIPKHPEGKKFMHSIRKIFRARPGYTLLFSDYDQIEIKLAAHFSFQDYMLEAIEKGQDLHELSAKKYFGVSKKDREFKMMRTVAKTMNYAMLYGAGGYRLHRQLIEDAGINLPIPICHDYIQTYWETNHMIAQLKVALEKEIERTQGVRNTYGRYTGIPHGFEYTGINTLIQSTAADIIKDKMPICQDILRDSKSHLLIQVHDELIFEIHRDDLKLVPLLIEAMEERLRFSIPITCSASIGKNWLEKRAIPDRILALPKVAV